MVKLIERTINGYTIKYNKDTQQYEVIIDGIVDAEFDSEDQAVDWINNKQDTDSLSRLKSMFKNARRLSRGQVDNYLSWDTTKYLDTDNIFLVKFKTKKDRVSGEAIAKKNGFKVIDRTDDDYGNSRTPYWSFFVVK